ncbi:MAG TPA: amidohydrolase family protein [Candidatus Hydrogenedentes bacterium]|nr:amidohydrolase family protein [Candidatus Hydrogenedentota bacterium]HPG65809.1 amidohydrolase family protein [Candidatus Hydrogenedentota bacterium]
MWRETTQHERDRRIFEEELGDFLPRQILDFHVHVWNEGVLPSGETYSCAGHPLTKYDIDDLAQDLAESYPGRETYAVCFGTPHVGYDKPRNDAYLAECCDRRRFFPFRLFDPLNDKPESFRRDLVEGRFLGIKPYLNYVRKADPNEVEIAEMLPDWAMGIVDELGLIVMLHIPRRGRLADPVNQRQIVRLCERYSNTPVVLAHVGRAYFLKNVVGHLDVLRDLPNCYFDLAMLNHWEVLEYLFAKVASEKILYATDTPIALAPGKSVEINDQYTYVTPVPWALSISDDHKQIVFTSFLYEELRAIKKAVERLGLGREFVEGVFFNHGMTLLDRVLSMR